jgi:predicted P-loop ATPase
VKLLAANKRTSSVRDWARYYISLGWQVVPLRPGTKKPYTDDWNTISLVHQPEDFSPGDNIGLRSRNGLIVIDLDSPEAIACADAFLPETGAVYGRRSKPRSKRLYLCREADGRPAFEKVIQFKDAAATDEKTATHVELRANHQDVAPISQHESGERCEWVSPHPRPAVLDGKSLFRSVRLLATCAEVSRYYPAPGARHDWFLALAGALKRLGLTEAETCQIIEHAGRYAGDDKLRDREQEIRTTYARDDQPTAGFNALRELTSKNFVKTLQTIWRGITEDHQGFVTHDGKILANSPKNIRRALEQLQAELSFDSFANKPLVKYGGRCVFLGDALRNRLWLDIEDRFGFLPPSMLFDIVLQDTAQRNPFHPVRDYLSNLRWDGTSRLDTWLITYGQAADNEYVRAVGALVLIAATRRVRQPGCKFDELLILESSQGLQKSSALRFLCPNPNWFSDDLPLHVEAKQIIERTGGKWIIEAADLSGKNKSSIEHLKASLSRQVDGPVRLAFAHLPDEIPRQFIIIGTTNSHKYLKDSTGNRRFWPVRVDSFDVEGIVRDRDQLWAEAAHREAADESIRLRPELYPLAELQQERRRLEDAWEAPLSKLFDQGQAYRVTTDELWDVLGVPMERRTDAGSTRIAEIMESLGFEHKKARALGNADGRTVKRWCRQGTQGALDHDDEIKS